MKLSAFNYQLSNKLRALLSVLLISVLFLIQDSGSQIQVHAQIPSPIPIPCTSIGDPEFHSLRPYQASPCSTEPASTAKFCGNDLTFHEKVPVNYPGSEQYLTGAGCVTSGSTVTCTYSVPVSNKITLDLDVANLPIMGNTEDVINSQSAAESLSNADKMNGYVSWYLNGVTQRSEYGDIKNTASNAATFSGPLKKLLPSAVLDAQRLESINAAKKTNHNQIVVCADPDNSGFFAGLFDLLGLGKYKAKSCYAGNNTKASGDKVLRLSSWNDKFRFNIISNAAVKVWLAGLKLIYPNAANAIEKSVGNHWIYAKPPLPWDNGKNEAFKTEAEYQKSYQEWKGNICAIIPIINKVVCLKNVFVPSYYADLYSYIPLSSTEDLKGKIEIENPPAVTSYSLNGIDVSGISFNTDKSSILFFPHMQESTELADTLQDTFVSKNEKGNKKEAPTNVSPPASCTTVDVRSNKGDKLFADKLTGTLKYTAAFSCTYNANPTCSGTCVGSIGDCKAEGGGAGKGNCNNGLYCCKIPNVSPPPPSTQTCEKEVDINLSTLSFTPKVDDIWSQLVAGPQSIFKRIFPKTNAPGSVGQIKDMPGSTAITYSGGGVTQSTADLKFPHIGSIGEYFLKGIQTALRPKGYGEPISFDPGPISTTTGTTFGDICAVATAYNIPCCQLQGIEQVETGGGANLGTETCNTKNGTFSCCNGNVCGPGQINCSQYNGFTGNDKIDVCSTVGAAELAARAMLLKLCQADGHCTSYDWSVWGTYIMQNYKIEYGDYTATGYFYGVNSCTPTGCSQLRWGTGKSYCDGVKSYCETGSVLPEVPYNLAYCKQCRDEMVASGMPTFKCSGE